jgi:hypothetical protein
VERLKLIVQNRRFLVFSAKGQAPNLASQAMGAAPYALTCLDGHLLALKEQIFLRLAPAGWFS